MGAATVRDYSTGANTVVVARHLGVHALVRRSVALALARAT